MAVNFPEHITLAEAWKILETRFAKDADKFKTKMEITAALDRVLAEDILAGRNVPHYAASAVDGYALRSADTAGASAATPAKVGAGEWQWMNTGAALPEWADCVLMVEDSSMEGETLSVFKPLTPSANVRPLGEDVMAGQIIAREGETVSPALISLFLSPAGYAGFNLVISAIGVVLFTGLTAWDSQRIADMNAMYGQDMTSEELTKIGILGALDLYLDFINIFLYLVRLFGRSDN